MATILQQLTGSIMQLQQGLDTRFTSLNTRLSGEESQQVLNNKDILEAFGQLEERIIAVKKRSHDKTIED